MTKLQMFALYVNVRPIVIGMPI